MKRFFECFLVTFCYWLAFFIGPALVLLWNNFSYYFSGLGYGSESLMYKVLTFFSQPISCFIAAAIAGSIGKAKHNLCVMVNCVVAACICGMFVLFYTFFIKDTMQFWVMAVSSIACIITAAMLAKELNPEQSDIENELDKCKAENAKLKANLDKYQDMIDVLSLITEEAGISMDEFADKLYVNFLISGGCSEADAKAQLQAKKKKNRSK